MSMIHFKQSFIFFKKENDSMSINLCKQSFNQALQYRHQIFDFRQEQVTVLEHL